jgi:enoyl-CoA hydratase/carnithine racemase
VTVSYHVDDRVAILTLDDAPRRNALSKAMIVDLNRLLDRSRQDGARAVVLAAKGPTFCAGANIDDLRSGWMEGSAPEADPIHFFRRLAEESRVTIAAVQGLAAGGGLELSLTCDLIIVGEKGAFVAPELGHGVVPPLGAALLPRSVGRHRAAEMILTRRKVDAEEALRIGLASRGAGTEAVVEVAAALARSIIRAVPPGALSVVKQQFARHPPIDWDSVLSSSAEVPSAEWREGLHAFLEKRKANYERFWADNDEARR